MARFALDTDTLTLYQSRHPRVIAAVRHHRADTAVTVISVEEQFGGWQAQVRRVTQPDQLAAAYQHWAEAVSALAGFSILSFTEAAIHEYLRLARLKLNVGRMDLRIAAIALEHGAAVVTRNRRDFSRVPGLAIVDWSV